MTTKSPSHTSKPRYGEQMIKRAETGCGLTDSPLAFDEDEMRSQLFTNVFSTIKMDKDLKLFFANLRASENSFESSFVPSRSRVR